MALKSGERKALKYAGLLVLASVVLALLLVGGLVYRNSSTANEKFIRFLYPSFYLKIEDQNGQPVRFADVSYTNGRNYWLGSNSSFARTTTDSDGLARFYLDGRQFDIQEILSDGYHIDFRPQLALVSDEPAQRLYPPSLKQFGKASPLVIKAWKLGEIADSYRGAGRLSLINEEAVELSLLQDHNADCLDDLPFPCRRKLVSASEPEAGLILIKLSKVGGRSDFRKSLGWSLSIRVPSGGIVEVEDLYLYEAPVEGYAPEWTLSHRRRNANEYIPDFLGTTHKFYVKLDGGKHFGRLYIEVSPFYKESSRLWLEYQVNADGGRNLDSSLRDADMGNSNIQRHFNYEYHGQ